jgi:hypothetical protein
MPYLAPLNYDRYFKKVFSDLTIAKRFLEDFLDVDIQEIEPLSTKKNVTDSARYVEFDFRCKINNAYVIIDMQQWYKPDVVQRFYLYHALNSALQMEGLPQKAIMLPQNQAKETRDYSELLPVITLVWMVQDNLDFTDDYKTFCLTPKDVITFLHDINLWQNPDIATLLEKRETLVKQLENNTKDLQFLQKNQLIYAFQKNIVKNNQYSKYFPWFELAEKTLKKISDKFAYSQYEQDEILHEVVRRLKKEIENPEEIKYIDDYSNYIDSVKRYDEGMMREGRLQAEKALLEQIEQALQREEQERKQKEAAEKQKETAIINLFKSKMEIAQIAKAFQMTEADVLSILKKNGITP